MSTPKELGYFFPAEWEPHEATWLTFPCHEDSFPGMMKEAVDVFMKFVKVISQGEKVRINVQDENVRQKVLEFIPEYGIDRNKIELFIHPSDDVWCRDHGPAFLINPAVADGNKKVIVNWGFNAWGGKYPFANDNAIPGLIADKLGFRVFSPGVIMEGGSVEFNGEGVIMTTKACLLNKNRNPHLSQYQIEQYLLNYYGAEEIHWLNDGIAGDDTDGHIDDVVRFVSENTVIIMAEPDRNDVNHEALKQNLKLLKNIKLRDGSSLEIIDIPMPEPVYHDGRRLPASYANFYITNTAVVVPVFNSKNDKIAVDIFTSLFPGRRIEPVESTSLVWGFGSFHCLSQQEPLV